MMFLLMPQWQHAEYPGHSDDGDSISYDTEWGCRWFLIDRNEVKGIWAVQFPYWAESNQKDPDWRPDRSAHGPTVNI